MVACACAETAVTARRSASVHGDGDFDGFVFLSTALGSRISMRPSRHDDAEVEPAVALERLQVQDRTVSGARR